MCLGGGREFAKCSYKDVASTSWRWFRAKESTSIYYENKIVPLRGCLFISGATPVLFLLAYAFV